MIESLIFAIFKYKIISKSEKIHLLRNSISKLMIVFLLISSLKTGMMIAATGNTSPTIDGKISPGEWDNTENYIIELGNGRSLNFSIQYSADYVYYLAIVDQTKAGDKIVLDVSQFHDYFGIEFDNNKDEVTMGSSSSPDDTIMVNYIVSGGTDMYMRGIVPNSAVADTDNGGTNDCLGAAGADNGHIIYEIRKPLITNDANGYDIQLKEGETYQVMVGVWDDQPPHSALATFNVPKDNSKFITLTVGGNKTESNIANILGFILIPIVVIVAFLLSKRPWVRAKE